MDCWRRSKHKNTGGRLLQVIFFYLKKKVASNTLLHPEYLLRLCSVWGNLRVSPYGGSQVGHTNTEAGVELHTDVLF